MAEQIQTQTVAKPATTVQTQPSGQQKESQTPPVEETSIWKKRGVLVVNCLSVCSGVGG